LLGHQDWEAKYTALKNHTAGDAMSNLGKRTAQLPVDIATNSLQSIRNFGNAGSLVQNAGGLRGGYTLTTLARGAIKNQAEKHGLGEVSTGLLDKTAATIGDAVSFAALSAASVAVNPLANKAFEIMPPITCTAARPARSRYPPTTSPW
jgi:hypothetical protein